jgi:hypothetical protein
LTAAVMTSSMPISWSSSMRVRADRSLLRAALIARPSSSLGRLASSARRVAISVRIAFASSSVMPARYCSAVRSADSTTSNRPDAMLSRAWVMRLRAA